VRYAAGQSAERRPLRPGRSARPAGGAEVNAWGRFRRSNVALAALAYVIGVTAMAIFAPLVANRRPLVVRTATGLSFPAFGDFLADDVDVDRPLPPGRVLARPLVPFSANEIDVAHRLMPPSGEHHFGTDDLGRDVLARMI